MIGVLIVLVLGSILVATVALTRATDAAEKVQAHRERLLTLTAQVTHLMHRDEPQDVTEPTESGAPRFREPSPEPMFMGRLAATRYGLGVENEEGLKPTFVEEAT